MDFFFIRLDRLFIESKIFRTISETKWERLAKRNKAKMPARLDLELHR